MIRYVPGQKVYYKYTAKYIFCVEESNRWNKKLYGNFWTVLYCLCVYGYGVLDFKHVMMCAESFRIPAN